MALNNKYIVKNMSSLQMEKQRLQDLCKLQEHKLKAHAQNFQQNYTKMVMNSFIPFKSKTKEKVSGAIELLNENILPAILGNTFKHGNDVTKNLMKIAQAVLISYSFKFFKNVLSKKKKAAIAEQMMVKTLHFKTNINCDECIQKVSRKLDALKEIYKWEVNTLSLNKLLTVTGENISASKIKSAVKLAGYKIENADSVFSKLHSYFFKSHKEDCCN